MKTKHAAKKFNWHIVQTHSDLYLYGPRPDLASASAKCEVHRRAPKSTWDILASRPAALFRFFPFVFLCFLVPDVQVQILASHHRWHHRHAFAWIFHTARRDSRYSAGCCCKSSNNNPPVSDRSGLRSAERLCWALHGSRAFGTNARGTLCLGVRPPHLSNAPGPCANFQEEVSQAGGGPWKTLFPTKSPPRKKNVVDVKIRKREAHCVGTP